MNSSEITVGCQVLLSVSPPYLKTADPMPMLRPADILEIGSQGIVIDRRPGDYWGVRFSKGVFLVESQYLEKLVP
ncbi:hypothetical protein RGRSB_1629 [cyanobacterium endosymbiont of Rhopalodia gibberula]|uniref:regulatory protein SipA n=1 Tax=cyanobacterium endosymbiont of Rhopalodia gibberula TaxID=1763363 RepID=UPI000DC70242|nr:DUF3148 domain-containing protein [cyanobacterium endosymbiont of Rhopalodia gibberula]BBA80036.1 hypothetical protein RGRSB_1629 [cyanobacterium endosymbiont of Rhopalodia gibberula]